MNPTYGAFMQDNWALTSKLTVNLGLRYDIETGTSNTDVPSPIQPGSRPLDKNNFSPRVGFAYDVYGDGRSVVRGGIGRYYDKVMLNLTSNERRSILGEFINVMIINPDFNNPLNGKTFADYQAQHIPAGLTVLDNNYQTPENDQVSVGLAQQIGQVYALQVDYVRSVGRYEPMTPSINFFEDPLTGLPENPAKFGRPFPQYTNITMTTSTGKSQYDGLQLGLNRRASRVTIGATLHAFSNARQPQRQPRRHADELVQSGRRVHVRGFGSAAPLHRQRGHLPAVRRSGVGDLLPRLAARHQRRRRRSTRSGSVTRAGGSSVDACPCTGATIARDSQRTVGYDKKLDIRLSKSVKVPGHVTVQGVLDVFNLLDTRNLTGYGANPFAKTYLQPSSSTNLFYQPRQVQLGFRISY